MFKNETAQQLSEYIKQKFNVKNEWMDEEETEYSWRIEAGIIINYHPNISKIKVTGPPMLEDEVNDIEETIQNYLNQIEVFF